MGIFNCFRNTPKPFTGDAEIWKKDDLSVKVDLAPIGGYRGKAGAVTIEHINGKLLTDFTSQELQQLSATIKLVQEIYAQHNILNVLTYAKQENGKLKFSMIPYPACNLKEKIQGLYHAIFGSPTLNHMQAQTIKDCLQSSYPYPIRATMPLPQVAGKDPFCNSKIISNQLIAEIEEQGKTYQLIHDNAPKGACSTDPHLLIIPKGEAGHVHFYAESSNDHRYAMLKIAQQAMKVLKSEKYPTLLYIKRDGAKLQGVQHSHGHVQGIQKFPNTLFDRIYTFFRLLCPSTLSKQDMQKRVSHYKTATNWN